MLKTAFLPNFPKTLFGSAKTGAAERLSSQRAAIEGEGLLELGSLLVTRKLELACVIDDR